MVRLVLEISKKWTGAASVVDRRGRLVGLVTDYDIRRSFAEGRTIADITIREMMNSKPTFIYSDETILRALEVMESRQKPLTVLPVADRRRRSVGMVHLRDLVSRGLISERLDS